MFDTDQESIHSYVLSFQDQEGDWLIADQVPWRYVYIYIYIVCLFSG